MIYNTLLLNEYMCIFDSDECFYNDGRVLFCGACCEYDCCDGVSG